MNSSTIITNPKSPPAYFASIQNPSIAEMAIAHKNSPPPSYRLLHDTSDKQASKNAAPQHQSMEKKSSDNCCTGACNCGACYDPCPYYGYPGQSSCCFVGYNPQCCDCGCSDCKCDGGSCKGDDAVSCLIIVGGAVLIGTSIGGIAYTCYELGTSFRDSNCCEITTRTLITAGCATAAGFGIAAALPPAAPAVVIALSVWGATMGAAAGAGTSKIITCRQPNFFEESNRREKTEPLLKADHLVACTPRR